MEQAWATARGHDASGVYHTLGVRPLINAFGSYTHHGGSVMRDEVVAAMRDASRDFVVIDELLDAVSADLVARIRRLAAVFRCGRSKRPRDREEDRDVPARVLVTACTSASLTLMAASVLVSGGDEALIGKRVIELPRTELGEANVILVDAESAKNVFCHALVVAGATLATYKSIAGLEAILQVGTVAIDDSPQKVAAVFYVDTPERRARPPPDSLTFEDVGETVAQRVPLLVDAANMMPRAQARWHYLPMASHVAISGGKALCGPQVRPRVARPAPPRPLTDRLRFPVVRPRAHARRRRHGAHAAQRIAQCAVHRARLQGRQGGNRRRVEGSRALCR